ncbi:nucleotidyltransferase domain-containing protein [Chitinophaga silvatica]|uniref:Nucleotidyltransferase domain-containing protein n=1 Tax=Chitinophaga silvatica TaxID=2282649 RepID=A0A3E1Y3G9_9BACT|nr:nucleotidyltransferase domain-containing protein [Chitinophaga silvatica]RFS19204.1 nucleotidyltransferase domain-containing protein [Chitinophaga silvatica]
MHSRILEQLAALEETNAVKILFACESGSRGWGFASTDSDFDVRFVYARPASTYLSIKEYRDVIELPVDEVLDINGWDIKKALKLFYKSNAPFYEWLQSPILYKETTDLRQTLLSLMDHYYSPRAACHHYLSMAHNTWTNDLQGEQVKLKKYFYVLRPLLACDWIAMGKGVAPMEFKDLRTTIEDNKVQKAIDELLIVKMKADEKSVWHADPRLMDWIGEKISTLRAQSAEFQDRPPIAIDSLDAVLQKYVNV